MSSSLLLWYVRLDSYFCSPLTIHFFSSEVHFSLFRRICSPFTIHLFVSSGGWHPWQDGDASAADPGHLHCGEKFSNKKRCLTTMAIGKSLWSQLNYLFLEKTYKTTAVRCSQGGRPDVCRAKTVQKKCLSHFLPFCHCQSVKHSGKSVDTQYVNIRGVPLKVYWLCRIW